MRIGFFANDDVGVTALELTLACTELDVLLIVVPEVGREETNERLQAMAGDRPFARVGRRLEPEFVRHLQTLGLDYIVLAWWPYVVDREVFSLPAQACLNFHPGFLPYGKGMNSNFWAVRDDEPFGVTIHFVDERLDGGDIICQRRITVGWEDTGQTLLARAKRELTDLYLTLLPDIVRGQLTRSPQATTGSFHRRVELEAASELDLDAPTTARSLLNLLRARMFTPSRLTTTPPGALIFREDGETYEVSVSIRRRERDDQRSDT
ncbi:formyltransferase family protein [Micromonospora zamorensis]|uniref:formyltransferase family protein n=1 Tax=Micromonospora zamorensis TaxID=709883 RepID=UPI003CE690AB